MTYLRYQSIVFVSTVICLGALDSRDRSSFAADQDSQQQIGEVPERAIADIVPQTPAVNRTPAADTNALDQKAMLDRIAKLEAAVVQLQKTITCLDVWDSLGTSASVPVFLPPHFKAGYVNQVIWNAYRCP